MVEGRRGEERGEGEGEKKREDREREKDRERREKDREEREGEEGQAYSLECGRVQGGVRKAGSEARQQFLCSTLQNMSKTAHQKKSLDFYKVLGPNERHPAPLTA